MPDKVGLNVEVGPPNWEQAFQSLQIFYKGSDVFPNLFEKLADYFKEYNVL